MFLSWKTFYKELKLTNFNNKKFISAQCAYHSIHNHLILGNDALMPINFNIYPFLWYFELKLPIFHTMIIKLKIFPQELTWVIRDFTNGFSDSPEVYDVSILADISCCRASAANHSRYPFWLSISDWMIAKNWSIMSITRDPPTLTAAAQTWCLKCREKIGD